MVDARLPREPGVDDHPHPGHGQGGLGHRGREDHPAPVPARQHRVLHGRRCPPVHLEHLHVTEVPQLPGHPRDLPHPRQETEHVALPLGQRPPHHRRHMRQRRRVHPHPVRRPHRPRRRRPHHLDGVGDTLRRDHRRPAQQPRPALGVRRRRRGHQPQPGPQRRPHVEQERRRRVRVQMPLVALVEHHHVDARQLLVPLQPLQQDPGRDDLHARVPPDDPLAAHGVADARADLLAQQPGHPPRRRPRGDPPRLGDDHPPYRAAVQQPRQGQGHQRRLAGAGRCDEHRRAVPGQGLVQRGQGVAHGQRVQGVVTDHAPSVVRPRNAASRPRLSPARTRRSPTPGSGSRAVGTSRPTRRCSTRATPAPPGRPAGGPPPRRP
ncbi:hypothetical protein SsS58_084121 [Streptomyces scabiei]|uniref:Uncharacterized protein n=1 Tax=Streptomyces scabiei TaxID=1930 RepID=A0A100JYC9_STRSC|nr:hypothetical protein SsS58_084121 [Streptomyces scabiei]